MFTIKQMMDFFAEPNFNEEAIRHNYQRILSLPIFDVQVSLFFEIEKRLMDLVKFANKITLH